MGWYNGKDGSYYQQHVEGEGCKITEEQKLFNKLSLKEIREGIAIAQQQYMREKDMREKDKSKLEIPYSKINEEIEYIVEEAKENVINEER